MTPTPQSSDLVSVRTKVGYGIGMSGLWLMFMTTALYLFYYYTDVYGISPAQAGLIFFIATMWDAVTDPLMGWIASKTNTSRGKYRPYILFGGVPLAISFLLMFVRPDIEGTGLFAFALATQLLFRTVFTTVYVPYTAMIARLSTNANERASIASVKSMFISVGAITVAFFGLPLVDILGGGEDQRGFFLTATIFAIVGAIAIVLCGSVTREGQSENVLGTDTSSPLPALSLLFRNSEFLKVFIGVMVFTGCYAMLNKLTVYFFQYSIGDRSSARWALSAISLAGILSPLFWAYLTKLTSKRIVWIVGAALAASTLLAFYLLGPTSVVTITGFYFAIGCGIQALLMTFYAMAADTMDFGEWKFGRRVEAIGFGVLSFANKTSLAIGGGLLGVVLSAVGYVPNEVQTPETLEGIRLSLALIPAAGFILSAIVISTFSLSAKRHGDIIQDLKNRHSGSEEQTALGE